ncbi:hypothetical protein BHE74_00017022 [Ensete ventricosum]|nr:hypothetical protein BHE74_00017022 [Ensete ventricosum]
MRVDFPGWEDGDPIGCISCAERYFHFHKTPDASMVDIVAIHLEGDAIQWYDWFKHTHDIPTWSREHRCKKGRLLVIEPIKDPEPEDVDVETEEEEPKPALSIVHTLAGYANPQTMKINGFLKHKSITVLIDIGSINNFMDSKVAARLTVQIEDCNRFDVKVADNRTLNCSHKCSQVKLVVQGQEITADLFLLQLDDYEVVFDIEWLSTLGDVSWNFFKLLMKIFNHMK